MSEFDLKFNIVDENVPPETYIAGRYKKSFAYYTLRERLPIIITQVIDNLSKDKDEIVQMYGEISREELKEIIGNISKLKYELQTDKELQLFTSNEPDQETWNTFINELKPGNKTFFSTCWLYAECYLYRKLHTFFAESKYLKYYDYFRKQKENTLIISLDAIEMIFKSIKNYQDFSIEKSYFKRLLKLNLWGNKCDLSISEGKEFKQTGDPFITIDTLDEFIISDNSDKIWDCISCQCSSKTNNIIDIINDNSGYELFTDLLVADYLIDSGFASTIRFFCKPIPWFISDVTPNDFNFLINYLANHPSHIINSMGKKWQQYFINGKFKLCEAYYFWTGPFEFYKMIDICPSLYKILSESKLIIFKGDLNYRKLIGDYTWDFTTEFNKCLRGFQPSNICALRTVKADIISGLEAGVAENLNKIDPKWMETGKYGIIQFASKS